MVEAVYRIMARLAWATAAVLALPVPVILCAWAAQA